LSNIVAIVQARFGSTRLPGKIFKDLSGKPVLWHVINRLSNSKLCNKFVVATTSEPDDDAVEIFCVENNFSYYRGSTENVLSRYYETAKVFGAEIIVRITSDCPLIDPQIIDKMLTSFFDDEPKAEYMSNVFPRTFPRGLDTEIFSLGVLEKAYKNGVTQNELEHVTPYIYQHPELFKIRNFANEMDLSFHRWTVDTAEDYDLLKKIYDASYTKGKIILLNDVLKLFEQYPDWININKHVQQKNM
jgi:spore coat polysaccharide biosynthesis protein SpsF